MKKLLFLILVSMVFFTSSLFAQETNINEKFKKSSIETLIKLMNDYYVFPDVAKKTETHLLAQLKEGHFKSYKNLKSFSEALTTSVQSINKDKHMRIRPTPPREAPDHSTARMIEDIWHQVDDSRKNNAGFQEAKKLENNIGYLDIRYFPSVEKGAAFADAYMKLLGSSNAIIIDLRKNRGGAPQMVQYLCSYFFDQHLHLNSLSFRDGEETHLDEFWTLDEVGGEKLPDVPLFVLTSSRTFSGAEEFSYNMQTQKRATLVGETTGGGANPGGMIPINDKLLVFIPNGRAINPITGTNWEGVGVVPEVKTSADQALDKAIELATISAKKYHKKLKSSTENMMRSIFTDLEKIDNTADTQSLTLENKITNGFKSLVSAHLMSEEDINNLGYQNLQTKKSIAAEIIFKSNSILFPKSPNTYDSYGEALAENGKIDLAIKSYEMAVKIATAQNDSDIELYKRGLNKVKKMKK